MQLKRCSVGQVMVSVPPSLALSCVCLTLLLSLLLAHEREGPCVHEALQALLEQHRAPGSGVVPMRPPRKRGRFVRLAN